MSTSPAVLSVLVMIDNAVSCELKITNRSRPLLAFLLFCVLVSLCPACLPFRLTSIKSLRHCICCSVLNHFFFFFFFMDYYRLLFRETANKPLF